MALTRKQQAALDALGSERRRRFVVAYVGEAMGNATKAAILAGYSADSAKAQGSELLTFPDVTEAVDALRKPKRDKRIMRMREAQRLLTRFARGQETEERLAGERGVVTISVGAKDRLKAVELLGRVQGAFITKLEGSIEINAPKSIVEARVKAEQLVRGLGGSITWGEPLALPEGDDDGD